MLEPFGVVGALKELSELIGWFLSHLLVLELLEEFLILKYNLEIIGRIPSSPEFKFSV